MALLNLCIADNLIPYFDIFLDSVLDCLKMLPLIFLTYVLIEIIERKVAFEKRGKLLSGKGAPVFGALAGIFPQCGVSVMSAKLYDKELISIGTVLSVFIATSDEAFSILLASDKRIALLPLIIIKFILAVIVGEIANAIFKRKIVYNSESITHEEICAHCHDHVKEDEDGKSHLIEKYVLVPLFHSLQTFLYVFIVTFIFGIFFQDGGIIGSEKFALFLSKANYFEPFITALIGLIPNCASSAILTTAYINGAITFGSLLAGLIANAGVGVAILFKNTSKLKRNILILVSLYIIGCAFGLTVTAVFSLIGWNL